MPRYIDADKVMEEIARMGGHGLCEWSTLGVRALINRQPTADVAQRAGWISVEERLPEVDGRQYLVWDDVQATVKKRFFYRIPPNIPLETYPHIREYFGNVSDYKRFTHWMPMPEPPKGGHHE
jgi:hypothetical protein